MKLLLPAIASAFLLWNASDLLPQTDTACDIHKLYADCSFRSFNDIPNNLPENITCLNIAGNNLSKINGDRWERYKSLQKLSLAQNNIERLDDDSFKFLEELSMLDLSLNKIRYNNISEAVFKPLKKLTYLDLKQNLTTIQLSESYPESLEHVGNLTTLMIDGLGQQPLPPLPRLTQLYFSGQYGRCNVPFLESNIFRFTRNIKDLFMASCSIEILQHGVLSSLPNIASLDVSWNTKLGFGSLTNITVGIVNNTEFKRLNINNVNEYGVGCTTLTVKELMYFNNTQLELVTLDSNSMVGLEQKAAFYIPKSLKYMSVRDNIMMRGKYAYEVITSGVLQNLVYYDTSEQFRSHVTDVIDELESDSVIITQREQPATEFERVSNCDNMFTRSLFKDYFEVIDERIKHFNITPVDAEKEENQLHESNIEYLDLSDNIPSTDKLAQIIYRNAPRIKYLNLSNNLAGYPNLSSNEIFLNFKNLRYLDLSRNGIKYIQRQAFERLCNLEKLFLSKNQLKKVSFNISAMENLQLLDIAYNHFETFSANEIASFDRLKNLQINLAHNRLQCTCPNTKTAVWIMENRHRFKHFKDTNCTFENFSTVAFNELNLKQLLLECSPPTYFALILGLSLGILTFIIIVSCGIVYRFKWNLRYLYYMAKFRLIGQYQPLEDREYEKDVFVSYANEDREFVCENVVTELENKGNLSLLVNDRDLRAGECVFSNSVRAITSSRRTLVILTHAYVQNKWCMYELNMARMEAAETERNVLCVILKEDVPTKHLPIEVIDIIKKKTYLEFPEEDIHMNVFWERLRATLS